MLALALAGAEPAQLSETDRRDITCVAVLGLIAYDQQHQARYSDRYPDVRERGRTWAGIVGDRITQTSGLPKEVVAFAIREAVNAEQERVKDIADSSVYFLPLVTACVKRMDAELAADAPLPKPQKRD